MSTYTDVASDCEHPPDGHLQSTGYFAGRSSSLIGWTGSWSLALCSAPARGFGSACASPRRLAEPWALRSGFGGRIK